MVLFESLRDCTVVVLYAGRKVTHRTGNCLRSFPNQATHATGWKQNVRSSNADLLPLHLREDHKDYLHSEMGLFKAQEHEKTAHTRGHAATGSL